MRLHLCIAATLGLLAALTAENASASSLDKALVQRVIKEREAEYQQCYIEALGWNPELKGRLVIRFTIDSDGQVSAAAAENSRTEHFPDEVMATCVAQEFRKLIFPPGPESAQVVYPMVFTPKSARPRQPNPSTW